ncbi:uncharacterized protein LOC115989394 [Quercus lobata]|uniref:DUF4220 domain-containing protein n=1 Tax=Quercus lobata TaxID=97700 RepID=A0A7N2R476_QUELO|nr:uncharacterized protein LOC115989394 [Quercus lobata]XP_030968925.1 uncharacterized protein LOC115989394 [Quercus lobata]
MQIFPPGLRTILNEWEIQALVLVSLSLQIILFVMGSRRKYWTSDMLSVILWITYLSADWSATVSLSVLSSNAGNIEDNAVDPKFMITAFWAPFFLLHLGGPDTITAYSLEDNELWRRHSLTLVIQVGVAVYVFLRAWTKTTLNFLAIPMFIAGIIKIWERIWVLRSASSEIFKASMLPSPDQGPNYARYMEEYRLKKEEGFDVKPGKFSDALFVGDFSFTAPENVMILDAAALQDAYHFFETYKQLFADLILSIQDKVNSQSFFQKASYDAAFKVIEVELGFMFDVFFTKAFMVYSKKGCLLRLISFFSTVSVLVAFLIMEKHAFTTADIIITYVLLVGAIFLEIYAVLILVISDWTMLMLSKHKNFVVDFLCKTISKIRFSKNKRWSNTMGQFNLISYCLEEKADKFRVIQKFLCRNQLPEKSRYQDSAEVSMKLKELIFGLLQEKSKSAKDPKTCKGLCAYRGDQVLKNSKCADCKEKEDRESEEESGEVRFDPVLQNAKCHYEIGEENYKTIEQSVEEEFDQSILLWHIATNLCYYSDWNTSPNSVKIQNCEESKLLSDYMLYLLVMRPFMLPNGIGQIRFQDTWAEAVEFFQERKSKCVGNQAKIILLEVSTEVPPSKVKGDRSKSLLFEGCRLAKSLQCLENEKKWELISHVWVEMLCYAASKCRWNHHAQQLTRGGELITHVWLLMAHLGITEQFQISKGHARAKLIVH